MDLALELLDHQIVDREGRLAGKVDDVELELDLDGSAHVSALLSGPGVLMERMGHRRFGRWRQRMERVLEPDDDWRTRIPLRSVRTIESRVRVNLDAADLASHGTERWVGDHAVGHIPGARHVD